MSDEGLMDLEGEAPEPVAAAPVSEAAPVEAAPEAPPAEADDLETVELNGQRVVPVSVLKALREERNSLKDRAAKADQLEAQVRELAPYAEFIRNNQGLLQARQPEPSPQAPAAPESDPDAVEAARLMDFYKPDGSLDAEKGAKWLSLQDRRASKLADQRVAPILQRTYQDQAELNYQRALALKDPNTGESLDRRVFQELWNTMSAEEQANPHVAAVVAAAAFGMDRMTAKPRQKVVAPPPNAPIVSEASGGVPQNRPSMSRFEESVAKERGIAPSKWQEHTKGYQTGRPSALED